MAYTHTHTRAPVLAGAGLKVAHATRREGKLEVGLDAAYRLFFEHFQVHDDSVRNLIREADRQAGRQTDRQGGRHPGHLVGSFDE
jgi:hypothetical protein